MLPEGKRLTDQGGLRAPVFLEFEKLFLGKRLAEQIPLRRFASQVEKKIELVLGFDAFPNHFQIQPVLWRVD